MQMQMSFRSTNLVIKSISFKSKGKIVELSHRFSNTGYVLSNLNLSKIQNESKKNTDNFRHLCVANHLQI